MDNKKTKKTTEKYCCKNCDFNTSKKYDYERHLQTKKHKNNIMDNQKTIKCECGKTYKYLSGLSKHKKQCTYKKNDTEWINAKKMLKNAKNAKCPFLCDCGRSYKHQSSYSRHCQSCKFEKKNNQLVKYEQNEDITKMIMKVLEKNTEILEEVKEISKEPKTNITNNNTQFNVMNYLNTECKDAMNFSDFIEEFVFSLDDLNLLHEKGYQEAMEQTFIKQLQDMDKTKRPIHCSDKKRKSFYVKDKDIWIKDENNMKILDGVKEITHKQFGAIKQWATYNKDWLDVEKKQDFFNMSVCELSKAKKEKYLNKLIIKLTSLSLK
jgi:hypothetical protein